MAEYNYINDTGTIVPDTSTLLTNVTTEYKDAFGQDLVTTPESPAGILINAEVEARSSVLKNNAIVANQINPNLAGGIFQDAILALSGAARNPAQFSVVPVTITGIPGTVVPQGFSGQVTGTSNNFASTGSTVIGVNGEVVVPFQCIQPGPIAAPANTLTTILPPGILGVETINNTIDATLGVLTQSDASAKVYRNNTLFGQGSAMARAIVSNVFTVQNVVSVAYFENYTNDPIVVDGVVTVAPHSIYLDVLGGIDIDVATAMQAKKQGGCGYSGSISVDVIEPVSGQTIVVQFDRPTPVPILAQVIISPNTAFIDPVTIVQNAILDYAAGLIQGQPGFTIRGDVSPFELSGAINIEAPNIFVQSLKISLASPISFGFDVIPILINQIATIDRASISVTISPPP